ncbi:hypothetical protein NYE54_14130 [Paenibacillus sp. FSL K6-1330]|uniref:hypothetical protein n=1 Tax=Paenibacillus sp. FSL K6-1330 TaxID=2975292 RepID=UPI0030DD1E69
MATSGILMEMQALVSVRLANRASLIEMKGPNVRSIGEFSDFDGNEGASVCSIGESS